MEKLSAFCDIIILIGAAVMAIYNIINVVSKPTSKFKKKKNEQLTNKIKEVIPEILLEHDLETRKKYLNDRQKYLEDIEKQVLADLQPLLLEIKEINLCQSKEIGNMNNSLKDILRQKIMVIYHTYRKYQIIPVSEKEKLEELYKDYKAQNGNSYIDKYYKRMQSWKEVPDEEFDEEIKEI